MAIYVGSRCCLLLLILIFPDGLCTKTICSPDAVIRGEQAKIICSFDKNLSRRDQAILVMKQDDVRVEHVLECYPNAVGNYSCHSSPGYLCDSSISSTLTLTLQIPSVTHNNAGSYACHTIPPLGDQAACSLTVQAESSVREVGSSNKFIVMATIMLAVVTVVLATSVVLLYRKLKWFRALERSVSSTQPSASCVLMTSDEL